MKLIRLSAAHRLTVLLAAWPLAVPAAPPAPSEIGITASLARVTVLHNDQAILVERHPDTFNLIDPDFSLTSRPCPPYCIQPMQLAPGVETLGELELIEHMQHLGRDPGLLLIDSRDADWIARSGLIPGAIHLPWTELHPAHNDPERIAELLQFRFGVTRHAGLWNFEHAKTLVFYCNGPWCGQSPTNIRQLLALGYPAHRLKWYRGGMQAWKALGFNTVQPGPAGVAGH